MHDVLFACVFFLAFTPSWGLACTHATECLEEPANSVAPALLQKDRVRRTLDPLTAQQRVSAFGVSDTSDAHVGAFGVSEIPANLVDRMVMSNPFKCEFVIKEFNGGDSRLASCDKATAAEAGINPASLSAEANGTDERFNALRVHLPVGSLPCCTTAPFCAAPECNASYLAAPPQTCTQRAPATNYRYMTHPDVFPAYHGVGGSFELDVQKHWDILSRLHGAHPSQPVFDLVLDLGANTGVVTEKLVMRRFAADYIMLEAQPYLKNLFAKRLGDAAWRDKFVLGQATWWEGAEDYHPQFEWLNFALSDKSGGVLDTMSYQYNFGNWDPAELDTTAEMATVDSIFPQRLSADFQARFANARSAYIKIDTEGMDQNVLKGMDNILAEKRGEDFLVNFMMLEFCNTCMEKVRTTNKLDAYDLKTLAQTLESLGFEAFLMGPRYIPLTHGSWDDAFVEFTKSKASDRCNVETYPKFMELFPEAFPDGKCLESVENPDSFCADLFALRASHPKAAEIKVALGACEESQDFHENDPQYDWTFWP